jgi:tetratricopeptide (TPR) repeat protein
MSYRIRLPSKSEPIDQTHLLTGLERFWFTVQQNRLAVLVGIAVVCVAVVIVAGVLWYDHENLQKALALYREATEHYLTRPADQPKQADQNLKQALAIYQQLVQDYPRTTVAPVALYQLANAFVQINDFDAAIDAYKRFVLLYPNHAMLVSLVQQRLGYAYLLKGDREQAVKAFSAVLDMPGALNKDHVLFELAKLEEVQSRPEGALAHYQELMKSYPNSPFASEAGVRSKVLEVKKGPDVPVVGTTESPTATGTAPSSSAPSKP